MEKSLEIYIGIYVESTLSEVAWTQWATTDLTQLSRSVVDKTIHQPSPISFQIKPASQTIHSPFPKTPSSIVITNSATDNSRIHIYSRTGKPHPRIDQQSNSISKVYSASIYTKGMRATL